MSNIILSKNSEVLIDNVMLSGITTHGLDRGAGAIDTTDIYSDQEMSVAGLKTVKHSATINFDNADPVHQKLDDPGVAVNLKVYPNGQLAGYGYEIPVYVSSFTWSAPKGDKISANVDFTPTGTLTKLGAV